MVNGRCSKTLVVAKPETAGPFVLKFGIWSSSALCEPMHRQIFLKYGSLAMLVARDTCGYIMCFWPLSYQRMTVLLSNKYIIIHIT